MPTRAQRTKATFMLSSKTVDDVQASKKGGIYTLDNFANFFADSDDKKWSVWEIWYVAYRKSG